MSNEYMSERSVSAPKHQALSAAAQPADLGLLLASCIRRRREELGFSIERAAQLCGIEPSQWQALEAGWVPNLESGLVDAIAGTLESLRTTCLSPTSAALPTAPV